MSLTAQQIVTDACQIAKAPGFLAQGGRQLNLLLDELWRIRNLQMNRVEVDIPLTIGSIGGYLLESDYERTYDMFFMLDGEPFFLDHVSQEKFDRDNIQGSVTGYPYEWTSDLSNTTTVISGARQPGVLYVYPPPNIAITLTHRYFCSRRAITSPEISATVPWFPDTDLLVVGTAYRMMRFSDDDRHDRWQKQFEDGLRKYLIQDGDEQGVGKEVKLDPTRFRTSPVGVKRTKQDPW